MVEIMKPSIKEAKKHWRIHTQRVLTTECLQEFKRGEVWIINEGSPTVCSLNGRYQLAFRINGQGHIICERTYNQKIAQYFQ